MTASHLPLIIAALVFCAFILWKVRPVLPRTAGIDRDTLKEVHKRLEGARSDVERAGILCDAAETAARTLGGLSSAVAYYQRAMKADPTSLEVVERACKTLWKRPRSLEALLWRRLGADAWAGPARAATIATLKQLGALYAGPLHSSPRARALENAVLALES